MTIKDLMERDVVTVTEDATLEEAVRLLEKSRNSGLPVVDSEGNLLGIVTEHDIIRMIVPSYEASMSEENSKLNMDFFLNARADQVRSKPVSSVMTRNTITLTEDDPVIKATSTMLLKKIKVLPVVRVNKVVGMISRINVASALLKASEFASV